MENSSFVISPSFATWQIKTLQTKDPTSIDYYKDTGYTEALVNYLGMMSYRDQQGIFI